MSLAALFPDQDYQFQMRFERGEPARFFQHASDHAAIIAQRADWLATDPETYSALLPEGTPLLTETIDLARAWQNMPAPPVQASPLENLLALGQFWEPDFLLLQSGSDEKIRLLGGCLCFPSSWRLQEKIGRALEFIHGPVPGLNNAMGASIHKFLGQLKPDVAWLRTNWGLTASPELNHHPDRHLPTLTAAARIDEVWLRVEHQALIALPKSKGILFGIRIALHSLAEVRENAPAAAGLLRALRTMPPDVALYKGISAARNRLLDLLAP